MGILKEARENGLHVEDVPPKVHCMVFEDNIGALKLARLPKMRPCTKHINQAFHHFREHVERKDIIVNATPTDDQMADIGSFPELCIYFAFSRITFHLHYICITFAFRIAPRIDILALHFINISKCQINVK